MQFQDSRIYKSMVEVPFHKVASKVLRLTEEGRDVNFTDDSGRTFLHLAAEHADKFRDPRALPVVYQLMTSGINVNATDVDGCTCLHRVVRAEGAWKIIIALLRCGADPGLKDGSGRTAEQILTEDKPPGWQENLHWLQKYSPGLRQALLADNVDRDVIQRLLSYWCRLVVKQNGDLLDLVEEYRESPKCQQSILELLEQYRDTNELAIAALSGSASKIKHHVQTGNPDVNTCDYSYQYLHQSSPEIPQPLLAAAWEQNSYDVIDALMGLSPDTSVLYSNHKNRPKRPLFFHMISGIPRPDSVSLVHRVLRSSDLSRRNEKGQTVLFEAIRHQMHASVVGAILTYGVNLSARDYKGRTARDYAEALGYTEYVTVIDDYVIQTVLEMKDDVIEDWVIHAYDHVVDIIKPETTSKRRLCEKLEDNRLYKDMAKCLSGIPRMERVCRRILESTDRCDVQTVHRHAKGVVTVCVNRCGQTLLHRALLTRDQATVTDILSAFPYLIDTTDNMQRSPLHYAYLLYGKTHEVSRMLIYLGSRTDMTDVCGRLPDDYRREVLTTHEYSTLLKDVEDFESGIILKEMKFEESLDTAIQNGDLHQVKHLVQSAGQHVKMAAFSQKVFDCIDSGQSDIATYMLQRGCDPDIWKQYESCDPTDDICAMSKCRHPVTSLQERARTMDFTPLTEYIETLRKEKAVRSSSVEGGPTSLEVMTNFGTAQ